MKPRHKSLALIRPMEMMEVMEISDAKRRHQRRKGLRMKMLLSVRLVLKKNSALEAVCLRVSLQEISRCITYLLINSPSSSSTTDRLSESSSSEESDDLSDSYESFPSKRFDDSSSNLDSPHGDTEEEEEEEDDRSDECIVISSDEDSVELELSVTPTAPLTPGAQLDLDLEDWLESCRGDQTEEGCTACLQENSDVDSMVELQNCGPSDSEIMSPIQLEGNC